MSVYNKHLKLTPHEVATKSVMIDTYVIQDLYKMPIRVYHAVKKLVCAGERGAKCERQDIQEAITQLKMHLEHLDRNEFFIENEGQSKVEADPSLSFVPQNDHAKD